MFEGKELLQQLYTIRAIIVKMEEKTKEFIVLDNQYHSSMNKVNQEKTKGKKFTMDMLFIAAAMFGVLSCMACFNFDGIMFEQLLPLAICVLFSTDRPIMTKVIFACVVWKDVSNVVFALSLRAMLPTLLIIVAVIAFAATLRCLKERYKTSGSKRNVKILQKRNTVVAECHQMDSILRRNIEGWLPKQYVSYDKVSLFINELETKSNKTMEELIEHYLTFYTVWFFPDEEPSDRTILEETMKDYKNWNNRKHLGNVMGAYQCIRLRAA